MSIVLGGGGFTLIRNFCNFSPFFLVMPPPRYKGTLSSIYSSFINIYNFCKTIIMTILIIYMTSRDALFAEALGKPSLEKQQFFLELLLSSSNKVSTWPTCEFLYVSLYFRSFLMLWKASLVYSSCRLRRQTQNEDDLKTKDDLKMKMN